MADDAKRAAPEPGGGLSTRTVVAILIALLAVLFIVLNRDQTQVSFIFFKTQAPLWLALALVAAAGFVAGVLVGRRRYKPRND